MAEITIQLFDGHNLSFPEGTPDSVIDKVAKRETAVRKANSTQAELAKKGASGGQLMQGGIDPTEGNSFLQNLAIGSGKALSDTGLGIRQLASKIGIGNEEKVQQEVDQRKQQDAPLMQTGGGVTGNILTNIGTAIAPAAALTMAPKASAAAAAGRYLLSAPATLGGALTQGAQGAVLAGMQPVASDESRLQNIGTGALGGAAVPVAGMALKGVKAAVEPLYEGGRAQILARALRSAAGPNADDAMRSMAQAKELVPGSLPTAAETANSPGIAAMQRAAAAVDPEAYGARAIEQNQARTAAVRSIAGTEAEKANMEAVRDLMSESLYEAAKKSKTPITISDKKISELMSRPSLASAWDEAEKLAREAGVQSVTSKGELTGEALHYLKMAMDQKIADAKPGSPAQRLLVNTQKELLKWMDDAIPEYGKARANFASWSKPINAMEVGEALANKLEPALQGGGTRINASSYANALRDGDAVAAKATGFRGATLENTLQPGQRNILQNVLKDLERSAYAKDAGRGVGSDTIQKLAMTNLMERAGLPTGLANLPGLGRAGNWVYSQTDDLMRERLAKALLDPKETAKLMQAGVTSPQIKALAQALKSGGTNLALGGATTLVNAKQQ